MLKFVSPLVMKNPQIVCVIVTYNRKELLKRCLDAVCSQTYKPKTVYIIDNASTDGTIESVKKWGYYECERDSITVKYILNPKNEGGAGGFYLGMKTAYETGLYDAIWVMDDDGVPKKDCLMLLQSYLSTYDYIAPLVTSIENTDKLSFGCFGVEDVKEAVAKYSKNGLISNYACPFNGILYSSKLVMNIGYPKKEMFIWGDEGNYDIRAKQHLFSPITVVNAIHLHPADRQVKVKGIFGSRVVVINQPWKWYIFCRNMAYNLKLKHGKLISLFYLFLQYFKYSVYLLKKRNINFFVAMNIAYYKGYFEDFNNDVLHQM